MLRIPIACASCVVVGVLLFTTDGFVDGRAESPFEAPNILFIMTDDQAAWAWGATGSDQISTPNMDRIAHEGAMLPNSFVVTPVCSPSRASLLTSRYGTELGITDWINHEYEAPHLLHPLEPDLGLDSSTVTFVELLHEAGYATGLVGKWHLGQNDAYHPRTAGYAEFFGFRGGGTSAKDPRLESEDTVRVFDGYTQDVLTEHALDFIRRHADEPFMLSLHFRAPHTPWRPLPEEDWEPYRNQAIDIPNRDYPALDVERVRRMTREYLGSVASVDRNVGRLLDLLETLGLDERTLVVFTSDHGYNMGHNGIWHKGNGHWVLTESPPWTDSVPRNQRPNMYDHSLRVPTAVRLPGMIAPGTILDKTVSNLDWYPTLLAFAGVKVPESVRVRGRSFANLLQGGRPEEWDNDLYAQYSTHHQSRTRMRMYRTPRWKLVRDYLNDGRDEFYDLEHDSEERTNLIDSTDPEIRNAIARLDRRLRERMRAIDDPALP